MKFIDDFLNKITMYRLVLQYLAVLLIAAAFASFFGLLSFNPANLAFSTLLILATCWLTNALFARVFSAEPNVESVYITGLILALIITPVSPDNYAGIGFLIFASVWAMASKYIFALEKKHIFNPAAFGVTLSAFLLNQSATWWISGSMALLPLVILGGFLIVRKIRREDLVASFTLVAFATILATAPTGNLVTPVLQTLSHSAFFFLALVMLTEPLTMPPSRWLRVTYAAIVGFLFAPNIHLGSFYFSPELALLIGNVFVYAVSPKGRPILTLVQRSKIAEGTYEFIFAPDRPLRFKAGQYMEWTLGHRFADDRGNRRFFTIASSPTEKVVRLGVKFYAPESSFKRALWSMRANESLSASHIAGDFVLPNDKKKKLVFIAGGIGVTPFRSMVQYLIDTKDTRPVTLLYSNKTASEVAYRNVFDRAAQEIGMKTVYALTDEPVPLLGTHNGFIDRALIEQEVPDYKERVFYISGPHGMVTAFEKMLRDMGVSRFNIKTDYFPGFA
ncbi:MAG: RnfABCDGE type electron transport complex subunit D [Candidatus Pacebacteria bacterium]|nr:RnfABCDGE type electron transport complex subunit D [Candidatus Paceibacterota bacterium]